ncbi:MAG: hypothetical protein IT384_09905 [Deltaproteobacteria bacterium]|nr:hypothetical protein [Deltaproteobacteria bacterium]
MKITANSPHGSLRREARVALALAILSTACGGPADPPEAANEAAISASSVELMIPDLNGASHIVRSTSLSALSTSLVWRAQVDGRAYVLRASSKDGVTHLTVTQTGSTEQLTFRFDEASFAIESALGADGSIGMTYGGPLSSSPLTGPTADDLPAVAAYFDGLVADEIGMSAALALFALPQILQIEADGGTSSEASSKLLSGILKALKGVLKLIREVVGGGSGGNGCPGGSSASCTDSTGHESTVTCSDCSARCMQIYGVGGTLCDCGCGL